MSYSKPFTKSEYDANIVGFSEPLVHHPTHHPFDELCELVIARGWGNARIGVELDAHYYTARAHHHHITSGLADVRIEDNHEIVNWTRLVKSEAELVYMREAERIVTDQGGERLSHVARELIVIE
jgi:ectoine hydrolase